MSDYTNGDHTKSNYNKTGKKVKCISSGRTDLIYKKVYDVFVDNGGHEFVIDESCDRLYDSMEFPLWCEVFDDTVDTTNTTNETKPKFKVGDKVKVVNIYYISQFVDVINVGDTGVTGVIISIDDNDNITPYLVKFEDSNVRDNWWFTDKCIELIEDSINDVNTPNKKYNPLVVQQSGNHYKNGKIQPIEYSERNNLSTCQGNIVKYITRHKEKNGVDDLAKVVHYALLEALFVYGEDGATELRDKVDSLINIENKE